MKNETKIHAKAAAIAMLVGIVFMLLLAAIFQYYGNGYWRLKVPGGSIGIRI